MKVPRVLVRILVDLRRQAGPALALASLILVGALIIATAPGRVTPQTSAGSAHAAIVSSSPVSTGPAAPTHQALPPVIATDTPTPPPDPTAPPAPPTPTPAPSWHVVGSYSGSAPQTLPSFTTAHPWRMAWTCTPDQVTTHSYSFSFVADGASFAGFGDQCTNQVPNSGVFSPCEPGSQSRFPCDASHTYTISVSQSGQDPMATWTAAVEVWY